MDTAEEPPTVIKNQSATHSGSGMFENPSSPNNLAFEVPKNSPAIKSFAIQTENPVVIAGKSEVSSSESHSIMKTSTDFIPLPDMNENITSSQRLRSDNMSMSVTPSIATTNGTSARKRNQQARTKK